MITVLYVDDELDILDLVKSHMEDSGEFSVEIRSSVQDALNALDSRHYDAIVSDYQIPGMDGIGFLKSVREKHGDIPFIIFTGRGREQVAIEALNNGADFYLQKGRDLETQFVELMHVVKRSVVQKQLEKTLLQQEQRYHDLQNANDLIQSVAPDGHFLYVNKKWMETLGYKEDDIPNLGIFDIIHDESLAHCMDTFQRVISGENVGIIDAVFKTRDGKRIFVEGIANCQITDGKPQYTRGTFKDVTDRKMAENALRESEARYRVLVENVPDSILVHRDGIIKYISPGSAERLGYSHDEMLDQPFWHYISPEDQKTVADALKMRLAGKLIEPYDIEILTQSGERRAVEIRASQIEYDGLPSVLVVLTDITERKKMESVIRESEERFRSLVETTSDMVWEIDRDGRYTYVSPKIVDILGYEPQEVIGKTPFDLMPPDESLKIGRMFEKFLDAKKPIVRLENINRRRDGRHIILETSGEPVYAADQSVLGYRGIDRDVTQRKIVEEEIHQSEQYLKKLLQSIPTGVLVVDAETHTILQANPSALELIGAPGEQVIGKICHKFICPTAKGNCPITDMGKDIDRSERVLLNSNGESVPVLKSVIKLNLKGHPALIETFVDISDRKRAEEALKQANRQLTLMTKITRHDILNNVTVLLGYLFLMREGLSSPELRQYVDKMEATTKTIQSQIEFTQIYQDLGTHKPQWQDVHQIMSRVPVPSSVTLSSKIPGFEVYADPLLEKVFFNLMDNSLRHGQTVTEIQVSDSRTPENIVITWEDNGIGIPPKNKSQIFNRGYGKNTGFGLYLAREILALTGISITENGTSGQGARFEITVPSGRFRPTETQE